MSSFVEQSTLGSNGQPVVAPSHQILRLATVQQEPPKHSIFLGIPLEIRHIIYELVHDGSPLVGRLRGPLESDEDTHHQVARGRKSQEEHEAGRATTYARPSTACNKTSPTHAQAKPQVTEISQKSSETEEHPHALLHVCRQTYEEYAPFAYKGAEFTFCITSKDYTQPSILFAPPALLDNLYTVDVELDLEGIPECHWEELITLIQRCALRFKKLSHLGLVSWGCVNRPDDADCLCNNHCDFSTPQYLKELARMPRLQTCVLERGAVAWHYSRENAGDPFIPEFFIL